MKKMITAFLALSLMAGMGTAALAEGGSGTVKENGSQPIDVTAKYTGGTATDTVYSVDIVWEDMTFTYHESGTRTWNPSDHTYTDNTSAGWDKTTAGVTVTNHSNAEVAVALEYVPVEGNGISGALDEPAYTLKAGTENGYASADNKKSTFTISGTPNASVSVEGVTVGTITVKVSAAQ